MKVTMQHDKIEQVVIDDIRELTALLTFAEALAHRPMAHLTTEEMLISAQKYVRHWDELQQYSEGHPDDDLHFVDGIWDLVEQEFPKAKENAS